MNFGMIVAIIFFMIAFISSMGIYVAVKSKNTMFRNITGAVSVASLLIGISIFLFSGATKNVEVNGIKDEYMTDQYGNTTIKADLVNVTDYSKVNVEVFEGKKNVTKKEKVTTTLIPSKDQLSVRYTYTGSESKEQIVTVKINVNMQSITQNVLIKPSKDYVTPDIQEKMLAEEKSVLEKENIEIEKNGNTTDKNLETVVYGNRQYQQVDLAEFDVRKTGTIKRLNEDLKHQLEKSDLVKSVELTDKNIIYVAVDESVLKFSKEEKEVVNELVGRRVLGLQRGTLSLSDGTPDIPIEIFVGDKLVSKSINEEKVDVLETIE